MNSARFSLSSFKSSVKRYLGVMLVEAVVVVAIMGILLSVALPAMREFVIRNSLSAATNQFISAASLARSEAIKSGRPVVICRSINADADMAQCSGAATVKRDARDWASGWLVKVRDGDQVIWRQGRLDDSINVTGPNHSITYTASGYANFTFTKLVFNSGNDHARTVCISGSGRIKLRLDSNLC
ncbi:GspH/FimT family pseudopilin [Collimonas sp.]|jgi:type IV fimbrial biogenesis protein FimT|uniref:GspH/FimT family pseudopilin n=1 Tax=Collimonas sp. TaxID=1963772 RepID=UPI0037C11FD2